MYIACKRVDGRNTYFIRESYIEGDVYLNRDIMALGEYPGVFVCYPNNTGYYIDEAVEDCLIEKGVKATPDDIEKIFWPYVRPDIKYRYRYSFSRQKKKTVKNLDAGRFHMFDKRRLHFLKFGQMDQRRIYRMPSSLFSVLSDKSRDEIEQYFILKEKMLKPKEIKSYVYVVFDIQKHFDKTFAIEMPHVLDQEKVDECFLSEICRLNRDDRFWSGMKMASSLQEYLQRYMIMFFDATYSETRFFKDRLYDEINKRRFYRPFPLKSKETLYEEASTIFGVSTSELKKMSKRELVKCYRKKANELHPDKEGGSHDKFVELSQAFSELTQQIND